MGNPQPNHPFRFTGRQGSGDIPLGLGSDARLRAINPNIEPYKSRLAAEHVNVFDLSDVKSPDSTNHSKFVNSPDLVRLVGNRLASGR